MSEIILNSTPDGVAKVEVAYEEGTCWLKLKQMFYLFGVDIRTINEHLRSIFVTGELSEESVVRNFRRTASDGKSYDTKHYALDAISAVGYRVSSKQATEYRNWSTNTLKEFVIKGFALDDERLKGGQQ